MSAVEHVLGREVIDSRGNPTVEAEVHLASGAKGRAIVPSGASTGRHEAVERRDGGERYGGLGVLGAGAAGHGGIAGLVAGLEPEEHAIGGARTARAGTPDKPRLGANAMLAVSLATARAQAAVRGLPLWRSLAGDGPVTLPMPMVNIISGGLHAGRQLDFQDFLAIPAGARTYSRALEMVCAVHRAT